MTRHVTISFRAGGCFLLAVLLVMAAGCRSIGPGTVRRDRLHYSTAVADSWKEQLLLNIVRTRYGDAPAFLEVASLVSGYSLETGISLNGQFSPENLRGDSFAGGELSGKFTDRPTISYTPMTGEKFARSLMSPVPLDALWSVIQGGAPVDFLLGLTLQSLEGRRNLGLYSGHVQARDPEFLRALELLRSLQVAYVAETRLAWGPGGTEIWVSFHPPGTPGTGPARELPELKTLLGIPEATNEVRVVLTDFAPEPGVVGMRTRSLMQILSTLGAGVRIPAAHAAGGGVVPLEESEAPAGFIVHSAADRPKDPFVAVPYEGHWFWIDRDDLSSKTTLSAVTVLFNFLEGGGSKAAPVLTIPTN